MSTILITGGTGLVGQALSSMLRQRGHEVIILSRREAGDRRTSGEGTGATGGQSAFWDPARGIIDAEAIGRADHIIHLAGAGVAEKRWSAKRKKEIVESRTVSAALLVKALRETPNKVRSVVSASAIGWYGADPSIPNPRPFKEDDPADGAFLGETCRLWEAAITPVVSMGKRLVILRTGIVLSKQGGALAEFRKPIKSGIAAILESGRQVISWIHVDDLCRLYAEAIEDEDWQGVYNAVAPRPVDNRTLTRQLAEKLKGRFFVSVHVPAWLLKIVLGEMSIEVLKSATVSSARVSQTGFQFIFPSIESALPELTTPVV